MTLEDEHFNLFLNSESISELGPLEKVQKIEEAFNARILDSYRKYIENRDENLTFFNNLVKLLDHYIHPRAQEFSYFNYKLKEDFIRIKSLTGVQEIPLMVEYVAPDRLPPISQNFTKNWIEGKVPLIFGRLQECRGIARVMSQLLCCSLHFVNSHSGIKNEVIGE